MNLIFKQNMAAKMLMASADAKCCMRLVRVDKDTATLMLIVTVDGEEVMFADAETTLTTGDNIEVPGATIELRVS